MALSHCEIREASSGIRFALGESGRPLEHTTRHATSLDEQLRSAIAGKYLIQLTYKGIVRIAEPHDYGMHHGAPKLLIYQRRGSGGMPARSARGWRMLAVSKIDACIILTQTFGGSRGDSYRRHLAWDEIYARVT